MSSTARRTHAACQNAARIVLSLTVGIAMLLLLPTVSFAKQAVVPSQ